MSLLGSYFFLAANFARNSAAVIFKLSPSLLAPFVVANFFGFFFVWAIKKNIYLVVVHKGIILMEWNG